jgi:hypothetical protein
VRDNTAPIHVCDTVVAHPLAVVQYYGSAVHVWYVEHAGHNTPPEPRALQAPLPLPPTARCAVRRVWAAYRSQIGF